WKPPARSPEESMVWQKCSGIRRSYLEIRTFTLTPSLADFIQRSDSLIFYFSEQKSPSHRCTV
ncbi:hypothetical protein LLR08_22630, partial [Rouxiella badensis]|uniref:hypothetical protein n=1 Tax=Rouxiella badensis TaxID=1646377 RepID=UPI001D154199